MQRQWVRALQVLTSCVVGGRSIERLAVDDVPETASKLSFLCLRSSRLPPLITTHYQCLKPHRVWRNDECISLYCRRE